MKKQIGLTLVAMLGLLLTIGMLTTTCKQQAHAQTTGANGGTGGAGAAGGTGGTGAAGATSSGTSGTAGGAGGAGIHRIGIPGTNGVTK